VLDGLRGEHLIAELCRHEGIAEGPLLQLVQGIRGSRQAPICRDTARTATTGGILDLTT